MLAAALRMLRVVTLLLPAAGCVLVVPTIEHEGQCAITGTSACATCIRTNCQPTINACCDDASCSGTEGHSPVLDALDECATGNKTGCASGLGDAQSTTAGAVRTCVISTCQEACLAGTAVDVKWTCDTPRADDNDCAACVYKNCSTALDSCCDDATCKQDSGIETDISSCVGGDKPGCAYMLEHSSTGAAGVVRVCIAQKCAQAFCFGDYRAHQSCELYAGGGYCQCSDAQTSRGPDCSKSAVSGSTCVAGTSGCTCGRYSCETTTLGCECTFASPSQGSTECRVPYSETGDGRCCVKLTSQGATCECSRYKSACSSAQSEYPAESCNEETVLGVLEKRIVTKCSN